MNYILNTLFKTFSYMLNLLIVMIYIYIFTPYYSKRDGAIGLVHSIVKPLLVNRIQIGMFNLSPMILIMLIEIVSSKLYKL